MKNWGVLSTALLCTFTTGPVLALSVELVGSFGTESISDSPLRSLDVHAGRRSLFLGAESGAVFEVDFSGTLIRTVIGPAEDPGRLVQEPARGLALAPVLDRFWLTGDEHGFSGILDFTLSGESVGSFSFSAVQEDVQGLLFDDEGEVLRSVWGEFGGIEAYRVVRENEAGESGVFLDLPPVHGFPLPEDFPSSAIRTGVASLARSETFVVTTRDAQLIEVGFPEGPPATFTATVTVSHVDLRALGLQSAEDVAFDPGSEHLFVTDPAQRRVFELRIVETTFHRGDANSDGEVDIADPITTLGVLFLGQGAIRCEDAADSNDDGGVDLSDAIFTLGYLFLGGVAVADPGPNVCGIDPTEDSLGCVSFENCP